MVITNIDKDAPVITIADYSIDSTNQDVVIIASTSEGDLNFTSHTFTANGSFDFVATDAAGNSTTETVTITNIDKVSPTLVTYIVSEATISPNADGDKDTVSIDTKFSKEVIADINILDSDGNIVRDLYSNVAVTNPGAKVWDGKNNSEVVVPDGTYTVQVIGTDVSGNVLTDIEKTVVVDNASAKLAADHLVADPVTTQISLLPAVADLTLPDTVVAAARTAYDALTADQKALVTNLNVLTAAENSITTLEVAAAKLVADHAAADPVTDQITALPATIALTDKDAVVAARASYTALEVDQKALVTNLNVLTAAENSITTLEVAAAKLVADHAAADPVTDQIGLLPEVADLTLPGTVVSDARTAYDVLTADQKVLVTNYATLQAAEAQITTLEEAAAATTASLTAINGGTDVFADYATAGVTGVVEVNLTAYKSAISTTKTTKGSNLTLAEVQTQVDSVNTEVSAEASANTAVVAYETGSLTTLDQVATAESLKEAADTAVALVLNTTVHDAFATRISDRASAIASAKNSLLLGTISLNPSWMPDGYAHEVMQINYARNVAGHIDFTLKNANDLIAPAYYEFSGDMGVNSAGSFEWSYRDQHSALDPSGPEGYDQTALDAIWAADDTIVSAGTNVLITITLTMVDGSIQTVTTTHTVTTEDVLQADHDATNNTLLGNSITTDHNYTADGSYVHEVMQINYDRNVAGNVGIVLKNTDNNTVYYQESFNAGGPNPTGYFEWSYRDESPYIADGFASTRDAIWSADDTIVSADTPITITITLTPVSGDPQIITTTDTVTAEDVLDADHVDNNIATVASAKFAITAATYTNLQVTDTNNQDQKTAAVQAVVDGVKDTTTATAAFNAGTGNYDVAISKGAANDSTSVTASFSQSDADLAAATAGVSNLAELQTALANTGITIINITADIPGITEELVVGHAVTINGEGKTLTFTSALNALADGHRDGIFVMANGTTINDLSVVMAGTSNHWDGVYGIQFYGVTGGVVNNYTGTGADAALLVNGSAVELTGATTVSGNDFGGIEVSKGTPPNASVLTVTGTLVNSTEAYGKPTIWLINGQGTVAGANVPVTTNTTLNVAQTQYYLTDGNAVDSVVTLAAAKVTARGVLTDALATYTSTDYTDGNWITLNGFKTSGDTAIDAAANTDDVTTAQNTATAGMDGVPTIAETTSATLAAAKVTLINTISTANTNKTTVTESVDGTDVLIANEWVTSAVMTTYTDATTAAQVVSDNASATQSDVDSAITTLEAATSTFNSAKANGTM